MNTQKEIFDSKDRLVTQGAIVGMSDNYGPLSEFQGLVVSPYSEIESDGYCVAVFFGTEVCPSRFNFSFHEVNAWDRQYQKEMRSGEFSFLFADAVWQKCPRIIFFRPNELVIQDRWKIQTLAERLFKDRYHCVYGFPKGITETSADYMCFRKECKNKATRLALWNVWGSVYPIHVCEDCFPKTNCWCGDSLPDLKKPFLLANGEPAVI
jgi:hypothetical protein